MNTFENNIKRSFAAARQDADATKEEVAAVKADLIGFRDNMTEWLKYLEQSNKHMAAKIALLEKRLISLESEKISRSIQREDILLN